MRNKNLFEKKLVQLSSSIQECKRMVGDSRASGGEFIKKMEAMDEILEDLQSMIEQDNTIS
jgi:hypothetical protein